MDDHTTATIDLTSGRIAAELDAWALDLGLVEQGPYEREVRRLLAPSHRELIASLRSYFGLDVHHGLVLFEQVSADHMVRLAGDWYRVVGRKTEHTLAGDPQPFLIVEGDDDLPWSYPVGEGERFLVSKGAF